MDRTIQIITDILHSASGIPDFYIDNINTPIFTFTNDIWRVYFEDGITIDFSVKTGEELSTIANAIYEQYLYQSEEYGMGVK